MPVRVLDAADAASYRGVRLAALARDPLAFLTTAEEFAARPLEDVAARLRPTDQSITFGAVLDGSLVGLLILTRECGDVLLRSALEHVQTWPGVTSLHLAVMDTQTSARRLYERHGFQVWGRQPDAVRRDGQVLSEVWMWRPVATMP